MRGSIPRAGAERGEAMKTRPKLFRLAVWEVSRPRSLRRFGPVLTDSRDDMKLARDVILGFNEQEEKERDAWCIGLFPHKQSAVA